MVSLENLQGLFTGILLSAVVAILSSFFINYFFQRYQYIHQLELFKIQSKSSRDMILKNEVIDYLKESKKWSGILFVAHLILYAFAFIGIFIVWYAIIGMQTTPVIPINSTCLDHDVTISQHFTNITNYYNFTINEISIDRKPTIVSVKELSYLIQK